MLTFGNGSLIILRNPNYSIATAVTTTSGNISRSNIVIKRKYLLPLHLYLFVSYIGTTSGITHVLIHIQIPVLWL